MANLTRTTRDHDEIRRWAEERGGKPSHVKRTGSGEDIGILRIEFPGYTGEDTLEPIEWEQWFEKFDDRSLALLYQEETAGGERSNFNKIVSSETAEEAEEKSHGRGASSGKRSAAKKSGKGGFTGARGGAKKGGAVKKTAGTAKKTGSGAKKTASKKSGAAASKKKASKGATQGGGRKAAKKRGRSAGGRGSKASAGPKKSAGKRTARTAGRKSTSKKRRY
jgi:hypothetical protein